MADLSLRIKADFDEASRQFKALADSSDSTRKKIEKYLEGFSSESVDKFIDRQRLAGAAVTAVKGDVAAMEAQSAAYGREIERLIKSGLDPESEAIQRLAREQQTLKEKVEAAKKAQEAHEAVMKNVEKAAKACAAAFVAGVAALGAMTQKTAEAGDQYAKTARLIGITAEELQELQYAAKMSGVENLEESLKKLNKSVADVKKGTGSLTAALKDSNPELLNQIKNAGNNERAFNLLMDAIGKAPDEFSRAELAQAAFGKSGQSMILMAQNGAEGLANLREEARKYGLISNEAAENSEKYIDAQTRLKKALDGVRNNLTENLLPSVTAVVNRAAEFIANIKDWDSIIRRAAIALGVITAALTGFLIASKVAAAIKMVTAAMQGLNAAMSANIIGAIAAIILTVVIPALIYLYKNWDMVKTYIDQGVARLEYAFKWFGSVIKEKLLVAFAAIKAAGATLVDFIYGNIIRGVGKMLEIMGKLPFVGEMFDKASAAVGRLGSAMGDMAAQARANVAETIKSAREEQQATEQVLKEKLAAVDAEAQARREAIAARKSEAEKEMEEDVEREREKQAQITAVVIGTLKERLAAVKLNENQAQNERISEVESFLKQRAGLEGGDWERQKQFIQEQKDYLIENVAKTA